MRTYIFRCVFQKYISHCKYTMLYYINSYFLHAWKSSDSFYKLVHGFFPFYINFLLYSLHVLEIK